MVGWPQERWSWWPFLPEEGEGSKTLKIGGGCPCWSPWSSQAMPPPGKWIWGCRMTRWRKSTGEGSIYRTKWAGANLTYLFASSVKSEGVQVDMVTVRTIIKGLQRWCDSKRSWFWRYFTVQDRLVGSSAVFSNGNIADERISGEVWFRNSRNLQENRAEVVQIWRLITKLGGVIAERHHYWREVRSINDFILRNWGACVDTVFGHVSFEAHLELMKCRSADGAMVTSLQGSCRWRSILMGEQPNMTKSRSGDAFMPMANADGCRWRWKVVCRWS